MDGTHNMSTLKFNCWYNNLDYIKELMGSDLVNVVVIEYDKNIVISLLMKANQFLNPITSNNNSQVVDFAVDYILMPICWLKNLLKIWFFWIINVLLCCHGGWREYQIIDSVEGKCIEVPNFFNF